MIIGSTDNIIENLHQSDENRVFGSNFILTGENIGGMTLNFNTNDKNRVVYYVR